MRRVILYLIVVLLGFSCLAVTWRLEPPIQRMPKSKLKVVQNEPAKKEFHVRLFSRQKIELDELTVEIEWDEGVIDKPVVKYGMVTRRARPRLRAAGNHATIHFKNMSGEKAQIVGRGPIARLSFRQVDRDAKPGSRTVRVLSAKGLTPAGEQIDVAGITVARYTPKVKNAPPKAEAPKGNDQ